MVGHKFNFILEMDGEALDFFAFVKAPQKNSNCHFLFESFFLSTFAHEASSPEKSQKQKMTCENPPQSSPKSITPRHPPEFEVKTTSASRCIHRRPMITILLSILLVGIMLLSIPVLGPIVVTMSPSCFYSKRNIDTRRQFAFKDLFGKFSADFLSSGSKQVAVRSTELDTFTLVWESEDYAGDISSELTLHMMAR